ncbi:MAG: hypothetical protein K2X93_22285, partial [Candidatus Obscuribacterales bacterium]|nr:hypothetical protein [Candidatus Obscuribacterales bacterium]
MKSHLPPILLSVVLTSAVYCGPAPAIEQLSPATRDTEWATLCRSGSRAFERGAFAVAEDFLRRASSPEVLHLVSPIRRADTALNLATVLIAERKLTEAESLVATQQELVKRNGWTDRLIYLRIKRRLFEVYKAQNSRKTLAVSAEVVELSRRFFGLRSVQFVAAVIDRCGQLEVHQEWQGLVDSAKEGVSALATAKRSLRIMLQRFSLNSMLAVGLLKSGQIDASKSVTLKYLIPAMSSAESRTSNVSFALSRLASLSLAYADLNIAKKVEQVCYSRREAYPEPYNTARLAVAVATPQDNLSRREELLKGILVNKPSPANQQLAQLQLADVYFLQGDDKKAMLSIPSAVRSSVSDVDWYFVAARQCMERKDFELASRYIDTAAAITDRGGENSSSFHERRYQISRLRMIAKMRKSDSGFDAKLIPEFDAMLRDAFDTRAQCPKSKRLAADDEEFVELCNFFVYRLICLKQFANIDRTIARLETVLTRAVTERSDGRANWGLCAARVIGLQHSGKAVEALKVL